MQCKRCGARLQQGMLICPECGARQRRLPESVRCASCHGRVPIGLTVCPHCGRTVRPAGPRWGLWGILTVGVVVLGMWGLGRLPVERVRREIVDTRDRLSSLVQVLDLPTALPATPTAVRVAAALPTATPMAASAVAATQTLTVALTELADADQQVAEAITATLTMTATTVVASTAVVAPTVTAPSPATQSASLGTPSPTVTATPARALMTATAASGGAAPVRAATPPSGVVYVVKSGDTLAGIGAQYGLAWQDIATANGISAATGLQIGQTLRIPVAGSLPSPTRRATATRPPEAAPTVSLTVSAPVLENPSDGSRAEGETAEIELRWQPVPDMPPGALYQATIQYVEGGQARSEALTPTALTGQRFPPWLFGRADLPGRRYTWQVSVVQMATDGKGGEVAVPLSPPSASRWFEWQ